MDDHTLSADPKAILDEERQTISRTLFTIRGISIIQVILIHTIGINSDAALRAIYETAAPALGKISLFIDFYNMKVMLIGSGIAMATFGSSSASTSNLFKKRFNRFIVPLLVWIPVFDLLRALRDNSLTSLSMEMLINHIIRPYDIFWFIHALIYSMLLNWLLHFFLESKKSRFLVAALGYLMSYAARSFSHNEAFTLIQTVFYWYFFFSFGVYISPSLPKLLLIPPRQRVWGGISLFTIVATLFILSSKLELTHLQSLPIILFSGIAAWLAYFLLFSPIKELGLIKGPFITSIYNLIIYSGSLSMVIYLLHIFFINLGRVFTQSFFPDAIGLNILVGCLSGLLIPLLIYRLLHDNKLFSLVTGGVQPRAQLLAVPAHPGRGRRWDWRREVPLKDSED
jgi:hypothetical protein